MSDADEIDDVPPCKSCGVPWVEHLGIQGTCANLVRITKQVNLLRNLARNGGLEPDLLIEILDTILKDVK